VVTKCRRDIFVREYVHTVLAMLGLFITPLRAIQIFEGEHPAQLNGPLSSNLATVRNYTAIRKFMKLSRGQLVLSRGGKRRERYSGDN
jgi:hypothetical protein